MKKFMGLALLFSLATMGAFAQTSTETTSVKDLEKVVAEAKKAVEKAEGEKTKAENDLGEARKKLEKAKNDAGPDIEAKLRKATQEESEQKTLYDNKKAELDIEETAVTKMEEAEAKKKWEAKKAEVAQLTGLNQAIGAATIGVTSAEATVTAATGAHSDAVARLKGLEEALELAKKFPTPTSSKSDPKTDERLKKVEERLGKLEAFEKKTEGRLDKIEGILDGLKDIKEDIKKVDAKAERYPFPYLWVRGEEPDVKVWNEKRYVKYYPRTTSLDGRAVLYLLEEEAEKRKKK